MRSGGVTYGLAGSVQRIGRVHLVRKDGVWQSRSGEVSFGEAWLGRLALERIGLDRQVRDQNGKAGNVQRTGNSWMGRVSKDELRFGMAAAARTLLKRHRVVR